MDMRKHYFVTVDTQDIREISIPDSGIEFEIIASQNEIEEIEKLFMKKNKNAKKAVQYLAKPFDERGADSEREGYDEHLMEIYRKINELGTMQTKEKIKEIGLFD
ncbi:hypothetical protein CIL05_08925 [Virgibacillus profundi]|uniref:Uncharacterized protein n=1 Tax=Virgibacillus profundi TaxID=2024555 RepID=A0A2A2IFR7_9BACI|nr:hypothetical protein [Virgibacillus profundi]PAV29990.1 hypothetical protein CIL05_08925 [Virgibacillus profundi]PXY54163.1 hypothetical protein CIT14_09010 [Virgibacillus profundi]